MELHLRSREWSCSKRLKNVHLDCSIKELKISRKTTTFLLGLNRHFFVLMSFFYFLYFCVCPQPFSLHIYLLFVLQMHIIYSLYVSIVAITIRSDWDYIHTSIWISMSCLILLQEQIGMSIVPVQWLIDSQGQGCIKSPELK